MTKVEFKQKYPDVYNSIVEDGKVAGYVEGTTAGTEVAMAEGKKLGALEGAEAERARIKAVQDVALPGHEKLVAELAFDGKTTAGEAALKVMAAEKAVMASRADSYNKDGQAIDVPVPSDGDAVPSSPDAANASLPIEEKVKQQWDSDPRLRDEFGGNLNACLAFEKASAAGRVKIYGAKKTG